MAYVDLQLISAYVIAVCMIFYLKYIVVTALKKKK